MSDRIVSDIQCGVAGETFYIRYNTGANIVLYLCCIVLTKNADEEAAWLRETTPQNTRNSTKWSLKIFEDWQSSINFILNSK